MQPLPDATFLHQLADVADQQTLPRFRTELRVDTKPKEGFTFDPVTEADREAEIALRTMITLRFPDHGILGEELGESGSGPFQWVLDPIDGTRPYILGLPVWATLIGLKHRGKAALGMMSQPFIGERFWADSSGAWTERAAIRRPLRTRQGVALSDAILHTNAPEPLRGNSGFEKLNAQVKMTRYGAECYAFAMLAAGRIDLAFEPSLQPYDIVALIPIVERAGGVITTISGDRAENGGAILASACVELHEAALAILNS